MKNQSVILTIIASQLAFGAENAPIISNPTGFIQAENSLVKAGHKVQVNWEVHLQSKVPDLISTGGGDEIEAKTEIVAEVRFLGAALGNSNNPLWAEAVMSVNGVNEVPLFAGYADGTGTASSSFITLDAGSTLDFEFMTWRGSQPSRSNPIDRQGWSRLNPVRTGANDPRLQILVHGDPLPVYNPAFDQEFISSFVGPFISDDGTTVKLGPRDILILSELNNTLNDSADFQDSVVLISFQETE